MFGLLVSSLSAYLLGLPKTSCFDEMIILDYSSCKPEGYYSTIYGLNRRAWKDKLTFCLSVFTHWVYWLVPKWDSASAMSLMSLSFSGVIRSTSSWSRTLSMSFYASLNSSSDDVSLSAYELGLYPSSGIELGLCECSYGTPSLLLLCEKKSELSRKIILESCGVSFFGWVSARCFGKSKSAKDPRHKDSLGVSEETSGVKAC